MKEIKSSIKSTDLIEFYEGQVADPKRLLVEEFLLESQPGLMEYFTIKRDRELNDELGDELPVLEQNPSDLVRARLKRQVTLLRGNFFTNRKSLMATAAAILVIAGALYVREDFAIDEIGADSATTLSVDASSDLFAGATFL